MSQRDGLTRRQFLRTAAAASVAAPMIVPASVFGGEGKTPPSDCIAVGFIGCGKIVNDHHLSTLLTFDDVQAVAVCDVDQHRREHAKQRVDQAYSKNADYKRCPAFSDFRDLIARRD